MERSAIKLSGVMNPNQPFEVKWVSKPVKFKSKFDVMREEQRKGMVR
jgi:hypothetical protein